MCDGHMIKWMSVDTRYECMSVCLFSYACRNVRIPGPGFYSADLSEQVVEPQPAAHRYVIYTHHHMVIRSTRNVAGFVIQTLGTCMYMHVVMFVYA